MKKNVWYGLAILLVALLVGCAGPGALTKIPLTMPNGEKATMVAHNQVWPDWMLDRDTLALNYIVRGDVSEKQLAAVARVEDACRIYTGVVRPNNLVAVLSQGTIYGLAGAAGVGLGAIWGFPGAIFDQYAKYGGTAGGLAGTANGVITLGGQTYTFENCGSQVLGLFPSYDVRVIQKSPY